MTKIDELLEQIDKVQDDLRVLGRYKFRRNDQIVREFPCDTDKLYGKLDVAIEYLKSVQRDNPTAMLDEHWTGYEDMYMRFTTLTPETDQEYELRLSYALSEQQRMRKDRDERKRKQVIQDQIKALQAKL